MLAIPVDYSKLDSHGQVDRECLRQSAQLSGMAQVRIARDPAPNLQEML